MQWRSGRHDALGSIRAEPPIVAIMGAFGPAQIACLRRWREAGLRVVFLHLSDRPLRVFPTTLHGYERLPADLLHRPDRTAIIRQAVARHRCDALTAVAYAQHRAIVEALDGDGCVPCVSSPQVIDFLNGKLEQAELAQRVGLRVAERWTLVSQAEGVDLPDDAFPLVLRPDTPESAKPAFKAVRLDDRVALEAFLGQMEPGFRVVAQRFIYGPNIVVHGVRSCDRDTGAQAAFLGDYKYEGVTQRLRRIPLSPELDQQCRDFVAQAGIVGPYHFDFITDETGAPPCFLEVNGRLGGTSCKIYWLGFDEPLALLRSFGVIPWQREHERVPLVTRPVGNRQNLVKRLFHIVTGIPDPLDYPLLSKPALMLKLLGGILFWKDEIFSFRHLRSTIAYYLDLARI